MSDNLPTTAVKHPRFMGMRGRPLDLTVSVIATMGFLLFGYDRMCILIGHDTFLLTSYTRGRHVWHHFRATIYELLSRDIRQLDMARVCNRNIRDRV